MSLRTCRVMSSLSEDRYTFNCYESKFGRKLRSHALSQQRIACLLHATECCCLVNQVHSCTNDVARHSTTATQNSVVVLLTQTPYQNILQNLGQTFGPIGRVCCRPQSASVQPDDAGSGHGGGLPADAQSQLPQA